MAVPHEVVELDAVASGVGHCELDGCRRDLPGFKSASVPDFAVAVVVPALAGDGIGEASQSWVSLLDVSAGRR